MEINDATSTGNGQASLAHEVVSAVDSIEPGVPGEVEREV
jgi:hypothetical protein